MTGTIIQLSQLWILYMKELTPDLHFVQAEAHLPNHFSEIWADNSSSVTSCYVCEEFPVSVGDRVPPSRCTLASQRWFAAFEVRRTSESCLLIGKSKHFSLVPLSVGRLMFGSDEVRVSSVISRMEEIICTWNCASESFATSGSVLSVASFIVSSVSSSFSESENSRKQQGFLDTIDSERQAIEYLQCKQFQSLRWCKFHVRITCIRIFLL